MRAGTGSPWQGYRVCTGRYGYAAGSGYPPACYCIRYRVCVCAASSGYVPRGDTPPLRTYHRASMRPSGPMRRIKPCFLTKIGWLYMTKRAPNGLGSAGKALFRDLTREYDFNAGETKLVVEAAKIADIIGHLEADWAQKGRPTTDLGSARQLTIHPIIAEIRSQRLALASLLRQLKLSDEADEADTGRVIPMTRSEAARAAAQGRWRKGTA